MSYTNDIANDIAMELRKLDCKIRNADAIGQALTAIERLRAEFQKRLQETKPSLLQQQIDAKARHARALLGIAHLRPDVRDQIGLYLREHDQTLSKWLASLETVADVLDLLRDVPHRQSPFELDCAGAAADLICQLSPQTDLATLPKTADSPFYLTASFLWSAVSGKESQDLKRHCDAILESWRKGIAKDGNTTILSIDLRIPKGRR